MFGILLCMSHGILGSLFIFIQDIILWLGYPGIALVIALENIFPPIPSEAVLPLAGFLVSQGEFSTVGVIVASTVGALIGAYVLYLAGRFANNKWIHTLFAKYGRYFLMEEDDLDKSEEWFKKHGEPSIFFGRMVPLVRSLISIPAGYVNMPFWKFTIFTTAGSLIWNAALVIAGVILGESWEKVGGYIKQFEHLILAIIVLVGVYFIWKRRNVFKTWFK